MIGMLRGIVWSIELDKVILDVGGVGYVVHVPAGYLTNMKEGQEKVFHTHLLVRQDDLVIVGFNHQDEKTLFLQLLSVTGVGPKAALSILSTCVVNQIKIAIINEDSTLFTKVPGIGAKIAKRIILELKDKIKETELQTSSGEPIVVSENMNEALDTLLTLGFSRNEARQALSKVNGQTELPLEEQIKEALRFMAQPPKDK